MKKRKKKKRTSRSDPVSHIIQTQNKKQNPILKIKLNQNKQIWKKKKKPILPKPIGGEDDERPWRCWSSGWSGHGDACGGGPSRSLSLSLSLSDVKRWNVLEVKKKIKRRGAVCLVWRRKTRKRKKK